jgi:hypothetical protein
MFAAQTLGQLKKTTIKTWFDEVCPPPLIESYNKSDEIIKLVNGFTIYCMPTDNEQKIRSLNLGLVHLEEISGVKKSIYTQVLSRMRDSNVKNKAVICCTNPANTWIVDTFVDNEKRKNPEHPQHDQYNRFIRTFIWETKLNKYLPPNFIEMNTQNRPEWYRKKYFEGSFAYNSGMVYPTIADTFIDPYPTTKDTDEFGIPKEWERLIALDYGLRNPTAVPFGAIDPKSGEVVIFNEYYVREKTLPYHAHQLKERIGTIPAGTLRFMVIDPACKNRMNDVVNGKSVIDHFREYGLYFSLGNNNLEYGLSKVNTYIEAGKLKIYKTCINLIGELLGYVYPETDIDNADENLDEKPEKKNDHLCDALRYMIARLPDDPETLKLESHNPPDRWGGIRPLETIDYDDDFYEDKELDYLSFY